MTFVRLTPLAAVLCLLGAATVSPTAAQEDVAPFFEQVPAVLYETYGSTTAGFRPYFEMLVDKYNGVGTGTPWAIYRENAKVSYRITVLPERLASLPPIQQARSASSAEFSEAQWALWDKAWGTRHAAVYNAAPALSVVPPNFTLDDARALTYHRTTIHHVKWDQQRAFRDALRRRAELDREAAIDDFVFTVWVGNIGTETQTFMIRVMAESPEADQGPNRAARRAARQAYSDEFGVLVRAMAEASWHIERRDQFRQDDLSWSPAGS